MNEIDSAIVTFFGYGVKRVDSGGGLGYARRCLAVRAFVGGIEFLRGTILIGLL